MRLVPVHSATESLKAGRIRDWVEQAMPLAPNLIEALPAELRARQNLAGVADAIKATHFPESEADAEAARDRLTFEELFLYQAVLATRKRGRKSARPAPRLGAPGELVGRWVDSLPFEPTADQLAAFDEIDADLDSGEPMARLLMGEVGSGKTVVALYAMLRSLEAGFQAVLMAPTETLAEQHAATLGRLLAHEATPFALLTGSTPAPIRKQALNQLASGELGLVVGTHALIEPSVRFARLGLCVVDEQHRFGVEQRGALDDKGPAGLAPHILHMTATPIPRTLSLTAYGDLDTTALRELPAGRQPVATRIVEERERPGAYEFLRERLREGRQAFVVCPLVSESEKQQGKAAEREAARLAGAELREFELGVMHGQMPTPEKAEAMRRLRRGRVPGAGRDHRDRGRHRRRQRDRDGDRGRRALRRLPAAPAARPGGEGGARVDLPALPGSGGGEREKAPEGRRRGERRLPPRRGRPRPARRGRGARDPPARRSTLRLRAAARGHADPARGPRGGARAAAAPRLPRRSRARPAARRRPRALRRRGAGAALRIIAGELKGQRLVAPRGRKVRPTGDRVREAIFSSLGERVAGARVLDLFAGTGALAIEALSRGAERAVLVDRDTRAAIGNVERLGLRDRVELVRSDAGRWLASRDDGEPPFDLVFVDAPYRLADLVGQELETHLQRALASGGRAIVESGAGRPLEVADLDCLRRRRYGAADVAIYAHPEAGA